MSKIIEELSNYPLMKFYNCFVFDSKGKLLYSFNTRYYTEFIFLVNSCCLSSSKDFEISKHDEILNLNINLDYLELCNYEG